MNLLVRAPTRIDFAGGWSDVPLFAESEDGAVVNAAIDRTVTVECRPGGKAFRFHATDLLEHVTVKELHDLVYDGKLDLHKAAVNMLPMPGGVELISNSDVPVGSGLGASGALDVALIHALSVARNEKFDREDVAENAFQLETAVLGLVGGRQDQYAAAFGGFRAYFFGRRGVDSIEEIDVDMDRARDLRQHMVLAYTGQSHFSSRTHERVWRAYSDGNEAVVNAIRGMRDLVPDVVASLKQADWKNLASLVQENWNLQKALDPTISTGRSEELEASVVAAGAWGVKATG
ncbi:MAG: hypothetical protein OEZ54_12595, partial [Gemmatimonadota bacterium]|nr:hypothetical protein [Gemmatimonadota bacterium]